MTKENITEIINNVILTEIHFNRFNYCQAWVSSAIWDNNNAYHLIKSYDTIVGFVNEEEKTYYALGKWSRTTSKQQTQIYNALYRPYGYKFVQF